MTEHNDIQAHLLRKVAAGADRYRAAASRYIDVTRDLVDSVIEAHNRGISREQIASDLAAGMARQPLPSLTPADACPPSPTTATHNSEENHP